MAEFKVSADKARVAMAEQQRNKSVSDKTKETPPVMFYLRQKRLLTNMLIMMVVWLTSSLDYYMITFLVNTFD